MSTGGIASQSFLLGDPNDTRPLAAQFPQWCLIVMLNINPLYEDDDGVLAFSVILMLAAGLAHEEPPLAGPLPVQGANNAENGFELQAHTQTAKRRAIWVKAIRKAITTYLEHIHPRLYPQITQALGGHALFLNATLRQIHAVVTAICAAKVSDITRSNTILRQPLIYVNQQSLHAHYADHCAEHVFLAANHNVLTEEAKIAFYIDSINASSHAHIFAISMHRFHHDYPVIAAADRELNTLYQALIIDAAMLDVSPRAYAAKAIPAPTPTKATTTPKQKVRKQEWCWSHGKCFHTSIKCTTRAPGHMEAATISNQMGSTIPFADPRWQS